MGVATTYSVWVGLFCDPAASRAASRAWANEADKGDGFNAIPQKRHSGPNHQSPG